MCKSSCIVVREYVINGIFNNCTFSVCIFVQILALITHVRIDTLLQQEGTRAIFLEADSLTCLSTQQIIY